VVAGNQKKEELRQEALEGCRCWRTASRASIARGRRMKKQKVLLTPISFAVRFQEVLREFAFASSPAPTEVCSSVV